MVFLPTSSPAMNPSEHACATIEQALRRRGGRSWETGVAASGEALLAVSAADARAVFAEAGFLMP